jgi:excisionase family DNA binding protein
MMLKKRAVGPGAPTTRRFVAIVSESRAGGLNEEDFAMAMRTDFGVGARERPKASESRVMTVKELAEYLRVHPSTVYKLLHRRELPGFRIGTDWRFHREAIDQWCSGRSARMENRAPIRASRS